MSKHAVLGLTKAAALDGRAFNIAVSQLDIGMLSVVAHAARAFLLMQAQGTLKPSAANSQRCHKLTERLLKNREYLLLYELNNLRSMHIDYTGHALVYMASLPLSINNLSHVRRQTASPIEPADVILIDAYVDYYAIRWARIEMLRAWCPLFSLVCMHLLQRSIAFNATLCLMPQFAVQIVKSSCLVLFLIITALGSFKVTMRLTNTGVAFWLSPITSTRVKVLEL